MRFLSSKVLRRFAAGCAIFAACLFFGWTGWRVWILSEFGHALGAASELREGGQIQSVASGIQRGEISGGETRFPMQFRWKGGRPLSGERLPRKGRVGKLDARVFEGWRRLRSGERVVLPSFEGMALEGTVRLRREEGEWIRYGGVLEGGGGSFSLNVRQAPFEVAGSVHMFEREIGLEIRTDGAGEVLLVERPLRELMCWPALAAAAWQAGSAGEVAAAASASGVPRINTRPGARGLIYINFEGETTTEPVWNGGNPITAAPSSLSASAMEEVVARVAEDYAPFDLAVSTIRADYEAAAPGTRMRVIVTPTDTALRGTGGVAKTNSWKEAGKTESATIPAWVFLSSPKSIADGVSHEVGHTLGLNHDGSYRPFQREYYKGHDGNLSSPLSWAPIMGQSYSCSLSQWSKGEYFGANNLQDDLEIIARKENGFGYRLDQNPGLRTLELNGGRFEQGGVLVKSTVPDRYVFATAGGRFEVYAKPAVAPYANVDLKLELYDSFGSLVAQADPVDAIEASLTRDLGEGAYELHVRAAGTGSRPFDGYTTGYSEYGSLGAYVLAGTLSAPASVPTVLSPLLASAVVGKPFSYVFRLSEGASVLVDSGALPAGMVWNAGALALGGTPQTAGNYAIECTLSAAGRRVLRTLNLSVQAKALPGAGGAYGRASTVPTAPWTAQVQELPDGSQGVVSASGLIGDGGESWLRYLVPGGGVATFWWKVSSEIEADEIVCKVNGEVAHDADLGYPLIYSGESSWVRQRVRLEGESALVEFVYRKDFSVSEGRDRAWVYDFQVGRLPVFSKVPQSVSLKAGESAFWLEGAAEYADSYQWKRNGLPLSDGSRPGGSVVSGARTARLSVQGASVADSGVYVLEARSEVGSVLSRAAEVILPGAPVLTQLPPSSLSLRTGETLLLSFEVAGAKPYFVLWKKDGQPLRWTQQTQLVLRDVGAGASGLYEATVINAYGKVSTRTISVHVAP